LPVKRILPLVTILVLAAAPSFAAQPSTHGTHGAAAAESRTADGNVQTHRVPPGPATGKQMTQNSGHLLMMAYHRNVANFGQTLYRAAGQGATVPAPLARAAVAEMRRSTEEMEKQRALAMRDMQVNPDRQKMMDEHIVQVKTHLRQLEELVKNDRIDSGEVRKLLQAIFEECEGAGCETMPGPMHERQSCGHCQCRPMPGHAAMMQKMMQQVKTQDAELAELVQEMQGASRDRQLDLVVEAVTTMVEQRAELGAEMERMQRQMMRMHGGMMMEGEEDLGFEEDEEME